MKIRAPSALKTNARDETFEHVTRYLESWEAFRRAGGGMPTFIGRPVLVSDGILADKEVKPMAEMACCHMGLRRNPA